MNIPAELSADETKLKAAAAAALATAIADEQLAKSWLHSNFVPAVAIAIAFLIVGLAIGVKLGKHLI